jgi:hypothetical protein
LVTVISTVAAACGGAVATMLLSDSTVKSVAATVPNETADAPVNAEPEIVTTVPPPVVPVLGLTPETEGADPAV